jgi:Heparinase II/III-like protein/Heparinase II/III N-terminus
MASNMSGTLSKIRPRVARMSWDELRTRVEQLVNQRVDLVLRGIRVPPLRGGWPDICEEGPFFFSREDLNSRTELVKNKLPATIEETLHEANEICEHRFRLLGYEDLSYGAEIDWHLDAVHGKRASLKPWFKVCFLDFAEVGDHKVIWELNRHQHLVTLAKAWRFTREERYVRELLSQWYSWQQSNPYPMGINWASSLEVAFRSLSWLWIRALAADSTAITPRFQTDLVCALELNGRHIEKYLSTYFSPNTHLLGEAVALFFLGTTCPYLPAAERWRTTGWNILLREAGRQVRPDGVYFEQSLYYHVYALDFFLHARVLAGRAEIPVTEAFDTTLKRMLDVVAAVTQAGPDTFGDDDGGRVFNPRRNRAEHLRDPLAAGSVLFPQHVSRWAAQVTEEAVWLFGQAAISNEAPDNSPQLNSTCFSSAGIYVMASAHGRTGQAVIDAGPQGTGNSGHGHADALSLRISMDKEQWLVDAGTYCYVGDSSERDTFRGTAAHNTLQVDKQDQAIAEGPFIWRGLPDVRCQRWVVGESFSLFTGSHTGYKRLADPVVHSRLVFQLNEGFWLVRDVVEGTSSHELDIFWHFGSNLQIEEVDNGFLASTCDARAVRNSLRLAVLPLQAGWRWQLTSGFLSPVYGKKEAAPVLRCYASIKLPAEQATMLVPLLSRGDECGRFTKLPVHTETEYVSVYEYTSVPRAHRVFFAPTPAKPWQFGHLETDASVLYYGLENGKLAHLIVCEASHLKMNGQLAFAYDKKIERMECVLRNHDWQTFSSCDVPAQTWLEQATVS